METGSLDNQITECDDMADDKILRSPQDASKISLSEDYEVSYWTQKFGVSADELRDAVKAVGNGAAAVEKHLKG